MQSVIEPSSVCLLIGFSRWKHPFIPGFLASDEECRFIDQLSPELIEQTANIARVVVWSGKITAQITELCQRYHLPLWRMEDGFLRSVGLGVNLVPPLSLVLDRRGIYYDATGASDLEQLLAEAAFNDELLSHAALIRRRLVDSGLSKYNVGRDRLLSFPDQKCIVLVPGQVESDASIKLGSPVIKTNLALLQAVRKAKPEAYIVYKPHPDVLAGGRSREQGWSEINALADLIVTDISMATLLARVDELHTISSLAGFEALLRGKRVYTYGLPFYAGWGLTTDQLSCDRRTRVRTLDELVAAALILYPIYVDPESGRRIEVGEAIDYLVSQQGRARGPKLSTRFYRLLQRLFPALRKG